MSALAGCSAQPLPPYTPPPPQQALPAAQRGVFNNLESAIRSEHGPEVSGFTPLDRNVDGLRWRLAVIDSATTSIDAQYYLWYGDNSGRLLIKRLLDAADRGVRVRILVDDLNTLIRDAGTVMLRDEPAAWLDAHPNVELRLFNPWHRRDLGGRIGETLNDLERINQRMHNKALIVDNRAVIIGGRNLGDEYMGLNQAFNFHDMDLLGVGPVARQTSQIFDRYWNSQWVMPVSAFGIKVPRDDFETGRNELLGMLESSAPLRDFQIEPQLWHDDIEALQRFLLPGTSAVHADLPTDESFDQQMLGHIRSMLEGSETELLIVNAYIIPMKRSIAMLQSLHDRGVRVLILTNSLASQDVPAVNSHYRKWRKPILKAGASLYELRHDPEIQAQVVETPPVAAEFVGLHSKVIVADRRRVYVGSMNLDPRSATINTEMGVFVDSPELAAAMIALIERDIEPSNSWRVELNERGALRWSHDSSIVTRQPARDFWQRVQDVFFRIFPKELY